MGSEHQFRNVALAGVAIVGAYKLWKHARVGSPKHRCQIPECGMTTDELIQYYIEGSFTNNNGGRSFGSKILGSGITSSVSGSGNRDFNWTSCDTRKTKDDSIVLAFVDFTYKGKRTQTKIALINENGWWHSADDLTTFDEMWHNLTRLEELHQAQEEETSSHEQAYKKTSQNYWELDALFKEYIERSEVETERVRAAGVKAVEAAQTLLKQVNTLKEERDEAAEELASTKSRADEQLSQLQAKGAKCLSRHYEPIIEFLKKGRNSDNHILLEIDEELVDFFYGSDVLMTFANTRHCAARSTDASVIERAGDLGAILTNLQNGDILCVNNLHLLHETISEVLQPAMDKQEMDLIIGEGPSARSVRIDLPPFTIMGIIPKGEKTILTGMDHYRLDNGKVVPVSS